MGDELSRFYEVLPILFAALSLGTAIAAFMKLSTTSAGLMIGGSSAGSALTTIASKVLREAWAGSEQLLLISLASSTLHLIFGLGFAIGMFLLPMSVEELIKRSSAPSARW